jgi:Leu/Phe-tRNA-protein transferase
MMIWDGRNQPWILAGDDYRACADRLLAAGWDDEFCFAHPLSVDSVVDACLAGFMPMSARLMVPAGFRFGHRDGPIGTMAVDDASHEDASHEGTSLEDASREGTAVETDEPASDATGKPAGKTADGPAGEPASKPADGPAGEPAGKTADGPAGEPAGDRYCLKTFFTPKLHLERCLLDPSVARVARSVRHQVRRFRLSTNLAFHRVLAACVSMHGDGWLTARLCAVLSELHESRSHLPVKLVSVELWLDEALVAGEIGYSIGTAYASLSGFRSLDGAGTVQLAKLAAWLAAAGFGIWDLGMPMAYKSALGARATARPAWLDQLRAAYVRSIPGGMDPWVTHQEPSVSIT